jgi:hypothetical protein
MEIRNFLVCPWKRARNWPSSTRLCACILIGRSSTHVRHSESPMVRSACTVSDPCGHLSYLRSSSIIGHRIEPWMSSKTWRGCSNLYHDSCKLNIPAQPLQRMDTALCDHDSDALDFVVHNFEFLGATSASVLLHAGHGLIRAATSPRGWVSVGRISPAGGISASCRSMLNFSFGMNHAAHI